jgi:hypothetical protein
MLMAVEISQYLTARLSHHTDDEEEEEERGNMEMDIRI